MSVLYVIIGGAAGGLLGWLFDKVTGRRQAEAVPAEKEEKT